MELTVEQMDSIIEAYCNRVISELNKEEMENMLYDLLNSSFDNMSEREMEALVTAVYGEEYYQELVNEASKKEESFNTPIVPDETMEWMIDNFKS